MKKDWELVVSEEAWALAPFSKILKRDKTKGKELAMKEMIFIYFYCDIKSNYLLMKDAEKVEEIKHDIGLPEKWKVDDIIKDGIKLYKKEKSIIEQLYLQALQSASDVGDYLGNTKELLNERDMHGKPVYDIAKITTALDKVPKIMSNLKLAFNEVVKEKEDNENKKKGSRQFNTFEDGLTII